MAIAILTLSVCACGDPAAAGRATPPGKPDDPGGAAAPQPVDFRRLERLWPERQRILAEIQRAFDENLGVSVAVHYVRLHDVVPPDDERIALANRMLRGHVPECVPLIRTRSGIRFKEHPHKTRPKQDEEVHVAQAVATLAEVGTPLTSEVQLDDRSWTVRDLLDDLVANYYPKRFDVEWTAVALASYLRQPSWRNRFGERYNFDSLANELLARNADRQSCGGLHVLQAMAVLLDKRRSELSEDVQMALRDYLQSALRGGGGDERPPRPQLEIEWRDGLPRVRREIGPSLLVVGHTAELIPLVKRHIDIDLYESIGLHEEPTTWIVAELARLESRGEIEMSTICRVTHAFRAASLFLGRGSHPDCSSNQTRR